MAISEAAHPMWRGLLFIIVLLGSNLLTFHVGMSWHRSRELSSSGIYKQPPYIASSADERLPHHSWNRQSNNLTLLISKNRTNGSSERPVYSACLAAAQSESQELDQYVRAKRLPLGWSTVMAANSMVSSIGHACAGTKENEDALMRYMRYNVGEECPDDETVAHGLTLHGCEPLPRRRCFAKTPPHFVEPLPFPCCTWSTPPDDSVLWSAYKCKSFECLNDRKKKGVFEDCIDCFDLSFNGTENHRWIKPQNTNLDYTIDEVLWLKQGSVRIGLDMGGGTGTFAVRMREKNVTIVTTSLNSNGPFNNMMAMRGVVPLFVTVAVRLPFFDNTLDLVHSMHLLSNWMPTETLEFLLFDIDRVLRPGGLLWLDHFFCRRHELESVYVPLIEKLGYTKLKWGVGSKGDRRRAPALQEAYLSAVLEKPLSRVLSTRPNKF